jgi:hypothetical protein
MDSPISSRQLILNERQVLAERLRIAGNSFAEIALALGVTTERARQIVMLVKKRRAEEACQDKYPYLTLIPRVRRHLLSRFPPGELPKPSEVREMMRSGQLKKMPNLGKLALHQIEMWLQSHSV